MTMAGGWGGGPEPGTYTTRMYKCLAELHKYPELQEHQLHEFHILSAKRSGPLCPAVEISRGNIEVLSFFYRRDSYYSDSSLAALAKRAYKANVYQTNTKLRHQCETKNVAPSCRNISRHRIIIQKNSSKGCLLTMKEQLCLCASLGPWALIVLLPLPDRPVLNDVISTVALDDNVKDIYKDTWKYFKKRGSQHRAEKQKTLNWQAWSQWQET